MDTDQLLDRVAQGERSAAAQSPLQSPVPEPNTLALVALIGIAMQWNSGTKDAHSSALESYRRRGRRRHLLQAKRHGKISKSRIKKLRRFKRPQYRLRVDEVRVFYDVAEASIAVLAVVDKSAANEWLERHGEP